MVLRIGFLLLLWAFIFAIVYALRSDLFGAPVRKLPGDAASRPASNPVPAAAGAPIIASAPPAPPMPAGTAPGHTTDLPRATDSTSARILVITSGSAAGTTLPLDDDVITIGRSTDSTMAIVDEYTSTYHARLARSGDRWMLTDLDSTNGTKVNGSRVTGTVLLPVYTPVTIGTTTFELRP